MSRTKIFIVLTLVLVGGLLMFSACDNDGGAAAAGIVIGGADGELPPEGPDTNNGRPFNATPTAWDDRDTNRFLHGVNLTVLPIVSEPVEIELWRSFSSTVITTLEDSEVWQEMERRTGVRVNWFHPPVGQASENFSLRIAADDLPHAFVNPPAFPGGPAAAVEEGIYIELTPYYEAGWLPNFAWLRANHPDAAEISRGTTDDLGRILALHMIDIIPSHPWSGLWIRQDYLDNYGLDVPVTIQDWDHVLRTWRDSRGSWVLGFEYPDSPSGTGGVQTNSAFVGSFDAGFRRWLNLDGNAVHGSIQPGYADWLALMNSWFVDGILDPDFAVRTGDDRYAQIANGNFLAFDRAYGGMGQQLLTGRTHTPEMAVTPLGNPAREPGAHTRISSQNNSIVRGDRTHITDRVHNEDITEIVVRWFDYLFSQDGGDLLSYGIFDHTSRWDANGEVEWIHPVLTEDEDADFWTPVYLFKMRPMSFLRDSTAYVFVDEVWECIRVWGAADNSGILPVDLITLTPDEAAEMASIMTDVDTHIYEQTLAFIVGSRPLDQFDAFVAELESMGIRRAEEIQQAAFDRLLVR